MLHICKIELHQKQNTTKSKWPLHMYFFLRISVPNLFYAFCWLSHQTLIKQDQSITKKLWTTLGEMTVKRKQKKHKISSLWFYMDFTSTSILFICWQTNLDEWKWSKGAIFCSHIQTAKSTFFLFIHLVQSQCENIYL